MNNTSIYSYLVRILSPHFGVQKMQSLQLGFHQAVADHCGQKVVSATFLVQCAYFVAVLINGSFKAKVG